MHNPFAARAKTAPSTYPRVIFHSIRFSQLLASLIVGGIMCYFMYHLTHDHRGIPWTFIWLLSASLFSTAALLATIFLHCCTGLNPRLNMLINSSLTVLWAVSWLLLTLYSSGTLSHFCDVEHWEGEVGIMVCRIYKALFAFTLLGLIATLGALVLDFYVHRQQTRRGVYRLHDLDDGKRPDATRGPYTDESDSRAYGQGGLDEPRESEAWEAPRPSIGPYTESADLHAQKLGYTVPENQFEYDTGYHGAAPAPHHEGRLYGQ